MYTNKYFQKTTHRFSFIILVALRYEISFNFLFRLPEAFHARLFRSSLFGRKRGGLRPTKLLAAREKKPLVLGVRLILCKTDTFGTGLVCPFQRGVRLIKSRGSVTPVIIRK